MKRALIVALEMALLAALCACGSVEGERKLKYETREIHVDRDGMDLYGVAHVPSGVEEKMPTVIISHELGATLDRVKGYGEALAKEGYVTV